MLIGSKNPSILRQNILGVEKERYNMSHDMCMLVQRMMCKV